ncbi:MAG: glycosyltransferase [Clostridium sp.]
MKKKILIAYPEWIVGGSTTSLIALLENFDYSKYDVDLAMYEESLKADIPKEVNIIKNIKHKGYLNICKIKNPIFILKQIILLLRTKNEREREQILSRIQVMYSKKIEKEYDVAIGYLELWSHFYVYKNVKAKQKIAWYHIDYKKSGYNKKFDVEYLQEFNKIIAVSKECSEILKSEFPNSRDKVSYIENFVSEKKILENSLEEIEEIISEDVFTILTVCRLDIQTKGIDRIIEISNNMRKKNLKFRWILIGGGIFINEIKKSVLEKNLENHLLILGEKKNPYPYFKKANLFVLASRTEGNPMVILEAKLLKLPILTTEYGSAKNNIKEGIDGFVVPNDEGKLEVKLMEILNDEGRINNLRNKIQNSDKKNLEKIYSLLGEN